MGAKYDVLIAAGGFGSRSTGSNDRQGMPKCLWPFASGTLLSSLLVELAERNLSVLVSTNRPQFTSTIQRACDATESSLVFDPGFRTTIDLARMHHQLLRPEFVFLYGHTWMPVETLAPFCEGGEAIGTFATSSRRDPLAIGGRFAEPPFRVNSDHLSQSHASSWREYWTRTRRSPRLIKIGGPSEANTLRELRAYERSWANSAA